MPRNCWLLCLWLVLAGPVARAAERNGPGRPEVSARPVGPSIHQLELERHRFDPLRPRTPPDPAELERARTRSLSRVVYGYYPYWVHDLAAIRWADLTHLAWFAVELDADGQATDFHGWPDADTVAAAHAAGVRVDLTFTLFSGSGIRTLVGDPARRATAIATMLDAMEQGDADGVSVDFEGLIDGTRDDFTTFIGELRAELDRRGHPAAQISIAGPAVDWSGQFDLDALLDEADWYFVMGYGYFWSGSARAGPSGMLRVPAAWRPYQSRSMLRSLAEYSALIPAAKRHQIIHGVPYYGNEWLTESDAEGAATLEHIGSVTYSAARADLAAGRQRRWDDGVRNPWYAFEQGGTWHQVWYDDEQSLAAKYALAQDQDLGGVGIWALNYDRPHAELWDALESAFAEPPPQPPGHRYNPLPIDTFPFHDERDTTDGPGCYFNFYSCRPDLPEYGREWVYQLDLCQPGTLDARLADDPASDPDLQLLSAPDQDACLARAHLEIETALAPGRYLLVVDTYVDDSVELEGPYRLDVDFSPDPGSSPCPEHLVCRAGACQCPDPQQTDCAGTCLDTGADPLHCGSCDTACQPGQTCEQGRCQGEADEPDGGRPDGSDADRPAGGCGCGRRPTGAAGTWALLAALGLLLAGARSRRRHGR